jgi:hypothetical protein
VKNWIGTIIKRNNNNFGTTTNPKFDMCQNKERDTSEEQENDNLFLHKNSEQEEEDDYGDDFTLHKSLDL